MVGVVSAEHKQTRTACVNDISLYAS